MKSTVKKKIFLVEDDALQAASVAADLESAGYELVGSGSTAGQVLSQLPELDIDVLIMDVHLKHSAIDGINIVQKLGADYQPAIVFLSAFRDKATLERMFGTNPAYFLSKPYHEVDLISAIEIAYKRKQVQLNGEAEPAEELPARTKGLAVDNAIFVRTNVGYRKINSHDILYIESGPEGTLLHTTNKKYEMAITFTMLLDKVQHLPMVKIHRSYAVNLDAIDGFSETEVELNGTTLPLSRNYRSELISFFNKI